MDANAKAERGAKPEVIAAHVYRVVKNNIPNVTQWDLLCFSAQLTASAALDNPIFRPIAIELNKIIYAIYESHRDLESCLKSSSSQIEQLKSPEAQLSLELLSATLSSMTEEQFKSLASD